jgi:hypothetical protein
MKKFKLLALGIILFYRRVNTRAQVSVNVNIGSLHHGGPSGMQRQSIII